VREPILMFDRKGCPAIWKGLGKVTDDNADRDEENLIEVNDLLVEEVSIDGMCGVY
jgi:mycofactocin precursor